MYAEMRAPLDAAEYTNPSARAEAWMSFLITNGNSTLRDADATFISPAARNVAHSQVFARTKPQPSRTSRIADPRSRCSKGRGVSARAVAVETANVPASIRKATPALETAITTPPTAR